ncbi:uncharacterized protein Z520_03708 [Fonsecaea multimorphosa CBS 102226]|uniref:serine C-palmitoyltransferase n=1 Tax=Fonsecaea multimorphosa CBS 102226 TaxID=1442371 RepID=A0A0D2IVF4_9EURO|nr:uncharacterized protein Z520_03708 [Fonsecaea multimorphosa CBS 102226]KIY01042.1 hypothetical protein Z520_03708 [Fonsecaea multimorphosa CBS 102226]OAL21300.1 hypothetical protein AYO22_08023 [Fonsecaea multimorphosa]
MGFTEQTRIVSCLEPLKTAEQPIIIRIDETDSISSSDGSEPDTRRFQYAPPTRSSVSFQSSNENLPPHPLEHDVYQPPTARVWTKLAEGVRLAYTRGKVSLEQREREQKPVSVAGRFNHCYVYPLDNRSGKNERILMERWAPKLEVQDGHGTKQTVIQAASHNYAGFYSLTKDAEELQRLALEQLPIADSSAVRSLELAMHDGFAKFFSTDFCYTTSTGYGSNILAFSAILNEDWLVMFDDKCHNSMHVAAYQSHAGLVKKFPHGDFERMEVILAEHKDKFANILVSIEGFYSMDGTVPALDALARLKQKYKFTLLADEAHSLMCLGRTGRGCIEVWNEQHPDQSLPADLFDLRTGTLSKSVGAIGGIVCGKSRFATAVLKRRDEMLALGVDPVPTSSMIQTLHVLGQPTLLQRNLRRLTATATFVREELHRAGVHVYGNAISPILPVYAGRPSMAAKMSYALRKGGLLATPVSTPAVPFWESRVRICLSADHDNDTVEGLIMAIVKAAQNIGLIGNAKFEAKPFNYLDELPTEQESIEALQTADYIRQLIDQDIKTGTGTICDDAILDAGHAARTRYGLGSGGARWITGTSELHIQVEKLAARLTGTPEALTYPDSFIGLMSTIAALSRPVMGFKTHVFLVPESAPQAVWDGFRVASKNGAPKVQRYNDSLDMLLEQIRSYGKSTYITLFVDSAIESGRNGTNLRYISERIQRARGPAGMTILMRDSAGAGSLWHDGDHAPSTTSTSTSTTSASISTPKFRDHHVLVYGSFYTAFGLPGAYLAGSPVLLKELRYTSRGYMFTTSQQPFIMGMVAAELRRMMGMA